MPIHFRFRAYCVTYGGGTITLLRDRGLSHWQQPRPRKGTTWPCHPRVTQYFRARIAANGDTANKIGTYCVTVLADHHDVPCYVAAPSSTFDPSISSADEIPIEERASDEVTRGFGRQTAPAEWITGIITERGVIQPVDQATIARVLGAQ